MSYDGHKIGRNRRGEFLMPHDDRSEAEIWRDLADDEAIDRADADAGVEYGLAQALAKFCDLKLKPKVDVVISATTLAERGLDQTKVSASEVHRLLERTCRLTLSERYEVLRRMQALGVPLGGFGIPVRR